MNGENDLNYYFFMKVGPSNCFLQYAQQLGGLWVGYAGVAIPPVDKSGMCIKGKEQADLRYMTAASHEVNRKKVYVVSFSKDTLQVFQITGSIEYLQDNNQLDWKNPKLYSTFDRVWHKNVENNLDGIGSKKFMETHFGDKGWKFLPAKLVAAIPRASLMAPIDSLSVWQSFNRKTFQPMFALQGNQGYRDLTWLQDKPNLPALKISEKDSLSEGQFGKIIRLCLNSKVNIKNRSAFANLTEDQLIKTGFAMLNPAQVETIALHLCNDLDFCADVGTGKGLDVADVKGTVRHLHLEMRSKRIDLAIKKLESLGVQLSETLRSNIESTSSIRIQCKARKTNQTEHFGSVLIIEPGSQITGRKDTLFLESLLRSDSAMFPMLHDWLRVLTFDLSNQ